MRTLNEQWVEVIDGQEHMVKVGLSMKGEACRGCIYMGRVDECSHPCGCPMKNQFDPTTIVKDLGPVNEDGLLPCPFCGEYPRIGLEGKWVMGSLRTMYRIVCKGHAEIEWFSSIQEAIDAWNRRT